MRLNLAVDSRSLSDPGELGYAVQCLNTFLIATEFYGTDRVSFKAISFLSEHFPVFCLAVFPGLPGIIFSRARQAVWLLDLEPMWHVATRTASTYHICITSYAVVASSPLRPGRTRPMIVFPPA